MFFESLRNVQVFPIISLGNIPSAIGQRIFGQATKGIRRMPWHEKAMKDVVSCDKPRVGANNLKPGDLRMGQPNAGNAA